MTPEDNQENLAESFNVASSEYENQLERTDQLRATFERDQLKLRPAEFASQKARLEQQELKLSAAVAVRDEKRKQLDMARELESARQRRESTERALEEKMAEFTTAREKLLAKRATFEKLQRELPALESQLGFMMKEVAETKATLETLPIPD